ncbi:hypothetical protein MASR1M68_09690 [Elusimicrobiota bacterium]
MILNLSVKDIKSVGACIILSLILLYVYEFPYKKYATIFNEKEVVVERLTSIDKQLDNFEETKLKVAEQEPKIKEIVAGYKDFIVSNDELINNYKSKVVSVLKQYNVTEFEESIKSLQDNNANIVLEFSFNITYDKIYRILFDIEKFSIISKLDCTSNTVIFECSPILYSPALNDYFLGRQAQNIDDILKKGLFYEVADNVIKSVDIGYIPTLKDLLPTPRNPFVKSAEKEIVKEKAVKKTIVVKDTVTLPKFSLDGILYDEQNPVAIIEGNLYHVGSFYKKTVRIKNINPNSVDVEYSGKVFKIKMLN